MMTVHTRRTSHHRPNNIASMVLAHEQELAANNLRHRYVASSSSSSPREKSSDLSFLPFF